MRIAINCRSILKEHRTGIGRYAYHLIDCLGGILGNHQLDLYAPLKFFDFKRRLPSFSHQQYRRQLDYFSRGVKRADIYHLPSPYDIGSYTGKLVVTVHDLIHQSYPQSHTPETIHLTEKYMQAIVKQADYIICTSQCTREDLHRYYDFPKERSSVVYNGVDHRIFYVLSDQERVTEKLALPSVGIQRPFILFVGTIEPRKNLAGLLKGFALLKKRQVFAGQLVVVGMKGWMMDKIQPLIEELGLREDIVFTGYISDKQLCALYNLAEAFVFPSFYEGFGFPIIEAFCCGVPVIASRTSSCGEIAADAALTVEPSSSEEIAKAMELVLSNKDIAYGLRQKGLTRAQTFSFDQTAKETLNVYKKLI